MLLCIDIGNTNIKFGLFSGEQIIHHWRIATDRTRLADEYAMLLFQLMNASGVERSTISGCAISSVVPYLSGEFVDVSRRYLGLEPLVVRPGIRFGLHVNTRDPSEVGTDLIANAVAARRLYGTPAVIVSLGTATALVAVSEAGTLEGVAIAPGIITGAESLFRAAAVLPQVALVRPDQAIGKDTIRSMQAGIVFGYAALIDGLVERMRAELGGQAHVVATGGLAPLLAEETKTIQAVEPNLTLIGLRLIYELNR